MTTFFVHEPTLRTGLTVEFIDGPYAGVCGKLVYLSFDRNEVIVQTQTGNGLSGKVNEVARASHATHD